MSALQRYKEKLAKELKLPSPQCVYTPDVYFYKLSQAQRDTLHILREQEGTGILYK
jgi:hypothetical protein